jgi:hypothetical protein
MFREQQKIERPFDQEAYDEAIKWMLDTIKEIRKLYCSYDYFFCNSLCGFRNSCQMKKEIECNPNWKKVIKDAKKDG